VEEKKWVGDLDTVKSEAVRFCPKCSKQSYCITLNRNGVMLSAECILCGYIVRLPLDLSLLSDKRIDEILKDSSFTKKQLIELGNQCFGITQSKLIRLSKKRVIEVVRAAFNHERSLGIISQEARKAGEKRSS
jgi:Zn ribbon nucleic-acid-binding protein